MTDKGLRWIGVGLIALALAIVGSAVINASAGRYVVIQSPDAPDVLLDKRSGLACRWVRGGGVVRCASLRTMKPVAPPK